MANNEKRINRSISLESDLELEPKNPLEKEDMLSTMQQVGIQMGKIGEGASVNELRKIVQSNMPKTITEATAYVKQMERIKLAGEAAYQAAQELMGSVS